MKFSKCLPQYAGFILAVFVLVGCGSSEPAETATPESLADAVIQPTETAAPPTETVVPPTETAVLPTETAVPPTETAVPPTPEPPTPTPEPTPEPTAIPDPTPAWAAGLIGGTWFKPAEEIGGGTFTELYNRFDDDGKLYNEDSLAEVKRQFNAGRATAIYWFEGDVFVIRDARIFEGGCGVEIIGRYQITIVPNESMDFEYIEDGCGVRGSALIGMWTWMSP
jgi:hypothetical protein